MTLEHSHHALAMVASTSKEQSFGPGMTPGNRRDPTLAVAPAEPSYALVGDGGRHHEEGWVTAMEDEFLMSIISKPHINNTNYN